MAGERPWYEAAFGRGYLAVYPHRDLASARAEAAALVRQGLAGRALDLGCGFGRHTLALRELGLDAYGLDLSAELLAHARALGREARSGASLEGRLARGDFRALPFAPASFSAACMLFSSFGYLDDEGNARVLAELRRVLRAGAPAVLDLMNPARVRAGLVPESVRERDGFLLHERRALAEGGRRVTKEVRLERRGEPGARRWREDVRLYEPDELALLGRAAGLALERWAGDFDGSPLAPASPRQIAWLRAR